MSSTSRNWTTGYYAGFFWMGVVMTIACIALVLAGNTEMVYRLERSRFPLSWAFGGFAMLQFVAAELCHHAHMRGANDGKSSLTSNRNAYEI
jgi:hypothetical protein